MTDTDIASLTRFGDAPYLVFCDHASNRIPDALRCLGMPEDLLQTHIAWDIGAGDLTLALAERLNGAAFACAFSRLVIDANRALTAGDLIPAISDQIPVPGNQMLSEPARQARIETYHSPYHKMLAAAIDDMRSAHRAPFFISVHSFTKRLMGAPEERPWRIGLLWSEDEEHAHAMTRWLKQETDWKIGDNEPYDARQFNYSIDRHIGPRGLPHLTFEVRQDMLCDGRGVEEIADLLARGVQEAAARQTT